MSNRYRHLLLFLAAIASAQTQIDLKTQSKSVDFGSASSTIPFAKGAVLPATCTVGQMFFLTTGVAGQNTYGCATANVWTRQDAGQQSITLKTSGVVVGSAPVLDVSAGQGSLVAVSAAADVVTIQASIDTALMQTRADAQAGGSLLCQSTSVTSPGRQFECSLSPTLTAYSRGMMLNWMPDASSLNGGVTLDVDILGPTPIVKSDGVTAAGVGDIIGGHMYQLWNDGASFRLPPVAGATGDPGATGPPGTPGPSSVIVSGVAVLGTSSIAAGSCAAVVTVAAAGAATAGAGSNILADFSADPTSTTGYSPADGGMLSILKYPTVGSVNFKVCNNTASPITPGPVTLNWKVL